MDKRITPTENRLSRYTLPLIVTALILCTLVSYRHITRNGFVFDDTLYLVENPHVHQGIGPAAVKWAFTTFYGANWQPVTWLSEMLDYRLYGSNPLGHHATNLVFHIANTVLLLIVLRRMTGSVWKSAFVAAVFALHPLHVESVAWAAERKDVLSTFFMLVAIWGYWRYSERPSLRRYLLVASAFALGLMAKPMLVTLPFLLLLLDYWPLRRLQSAFGTTPPQPSPQRGGSCPLPVAGRVGEGLSRTPGRPLKASPTALIMEKTPLFALSFASSVITYLAQRSGGAVIQLEKFPVGLRIANAVVAYSAYVWKAIWPMGLAAYYSYPRAGVPVLSLVIALAVMVGVSAFVIRQAKPRPYLAVGWLWYVITLIPVIGLVQVGEQSMADRYMYIPLIGLSIMVAWGIPDLLMRRHALSLTRPIALGLAGVSGLVVVALMVATSAQVRYWESNYALFGRVVRVTSGGALAFSNYGIALAERGEYDQAIAQYRKAIEADPYYMHSYVNLANALKETGKAEEALQVYQEALEINPNYTNASVAAANIMAEQGHSDLAASEYAKALESSPDDASAHSNLAFFLSRQGKTDEAVDHFERAIELNPGFSKAHYGLAIIAFRQGDAERAVEHFNEALRIDPNYVEAHHGLGLVLRAQGRTGEAASQFREAIKLKPNFAEAHNDLGILLAQQGSVDEAMAHFADAVRYRPGFAEARCNLALALISKNDIAAAISEYEKAIKADPGYVQAHGGLAGALYAAGRYAEAWREVRIAESHGMKPPPDFLKALSSKMPPGQ